MTNTGGFSVSDLASIGTVDFENELSGVSLTDPNANGKSLVANSPLSIDASIDAKLGSILLAVSGQTDTDDVSISNNIKAGSIEIYAGDSIFFNEIASIDANDVSLNVSTNFDSLSSLTSNGIQRMENFTILSLCGTSNLEIFTPAVGKIRNGMIHQFSHRGMTYMESYLNTMNPTQDDYNINEQIGGREFITNVYFEKFIVQFR